MTCPDFPNALPTLRMSEKSAHLPLADAILANMVAISADAIIATDETQRIVFFNSGAETTFGFHAEEAIGMPLSKLLPERHRAAHAAHVQLFGEMGEHARRMGNRRPISGLRKNGEEFPAEASIARVEGEEQRLFTVVLRDMTDRVVIEQQLRNAVESRDQIAGIVSHDLMNPVQAIRMLASAILAKEGDDSVTPNVAEQIAIIRGAAQQMDALIKDLADVASIEAGRLRVHPSRYDAIELTRNSVEMLRPLAQSRHQRITFEVANELPAIHVDGDRVAQLFSNVLGNSMKFSAPGTTIRVRTRLEESGPAGEVRNFVVFSVTDEGIGIEPEHLPHVLNRYWQSAHEVRAGSGLGLAIAKGIVEAHAGWLEITSEIGAGTTVEFALPCME